MAEISIEELADSMYKLIEEYAGTKRFKGPDLLKEMILKYGEDKVSRDAGKKAVKALIDSGRCTYTYYGGGTFVELPPKEGVK
jgi:hypothetical protein